ncbi:major facilitator superfamily domain-containing protein [Ampelomyces quisqualis]|uniref:Major facilitator superfamily domain-containing protein n=1 Tax=Ampelomyces quisqualis TaxID=50730 RepID=A0A6A5QQW2_AMPQU|nr:major facilitator superfamily domain-containing protein [Ampelomyces quisqualis]
MGRSPPLPTLITFVALCLCIFLVALDTVLIPTALPTIALSFHIQDSLYAWIGSAYLLANAASVPFWGKSSDIFGRKPVIMAANVIFLVGSIVCALSMNVSMLVAGRVVQGFGGGGVVILVHVCVSDLFSIRDRSFYLGMLGGVWALASALGPVLGGVFAERLSWRWCFYINLPIISVSTIALYTTLRMHNPQTPLLAGVASLDWLGTTTILAAAVLLLVGLQLGCATSFAAPLVVTLIIVGCVLHLLFPVTQWWQERRGREPVLPLRIFKDVSNLCALGVCACDALAFNSVAYFLPLYLQVVLSRSPSMTGIYMLAIAVPLATVSFASGYLINQTGRFVEVLQAGLLFMTIGVGLLITLSTTRENGRLIPIMFVIGLGFGPNFGAPLIALQTRIQESDIATGTAAFGFVRMVFGALGVVIGQVIFQLLMAPHYDAFVDAGIMPDVAKQLARGEAISRARTVSAMPPAQSLAIKTSLSRALRGSWIFYTAISALGLLVSAGIKRKKLHRGMGSETPRTLNHRSTADKTEV